MSKCNSPTIKLQFVNPFHPVVKLKLSRFDQFIRHVSVLELYYACLPKLILGKMHKRLVFLTSIVCLIFKTSASFPPSSSSIGDCDFNDPSGVKDNITFICRYNTTNANKFFNLNVALICLNQQKKNIQMDSTIV